MGTTETSRPVVLQYVVACVLGLLAAYAVCWYRGHLSFLGVGSVGVGIVIVAAFIGYVAATRPVSRPVLTPVGALLFAAMATLGEVFSLNGTFASLASPSVFFGFLGYWAVAAMAVHAIFTGDRTSESRVAVPQSWENSNSRIRSFLLRHRVFLTAFAVILACWLITIVALFPGIGFYDSLWQLSQFRDYAPYTTQHPLSATLAMGMVSSLFSAFGDTVMFACYTLAQTILCAGVLAYIATWLVRCFAPAEYLSSQCCTPSNRIGGAAGRRAYWCTVVFFAVLPLFPIYAQSILKDLPYAVSIAIAVLLLVSVFSSKAVVTPRVFMVLYCLFIAGIAVFRNEGWIVAAVIAIIMAAKTQGSRRLFTAIVGAALAVLIFGLNAVTAPTLGATSGPTIEAFALPNQQIAREIKEHPESFTEEELQQLAAMLKPDMTPAMLGEQYAPDNSDTVKILFNPDTYSRRKIVSIWLRHLALHPVTYIEAFLSGVSGYYYPFTEKNERVGVR